MTTIKKRIGAWKRWKNQDRRGLVLSESTSTASMRYEKEPDASSSANGCDLTFMSSSSTLLHNKSGHASVKSESKTLQKFTDVPGYIHAYKPMQINGSNCDNSQVGSKSSGRKCDGKARLLSPSRLVICHEPAAAWPPLKSTSGRFSSCHEKENNPKAVNGNSSARKLGLSKKNQSQVCIVENESFDSNPPFDFRPRKEIVHAIKCHEKMGRALSKLVLSEMNQRNIGGSDSFTSTALTAASTFESFGTNSVENNRESDRLSATHGEQQFANANHVKKHTQDIFNSDKEYIVDIVRNQSSCSATLQVEAKGSWSLSDEIQWCASECSKDSNASAKTDCSSFFRHVAFLEGLEGHIRRFSSPQSSSEIKDDTDDKPSDESDTFFPTCDDLKSPPASDARAMKTPNKLPSIQVSKANEWDAHVLSPPCTPPALSYASSSNLSVDKETVTPAYNISKFPSCISTTRNAITPQPNRTSTPCSFDRNVLSEVVQKSLSSMESSILDKIKLHMDNDALEQRAYLEDLVDEKVTKVMVGQNLELQMAMGEMKRATDQAAKQAILKSKFQPRSSHVENVTNASAKHLTPIKNTCSVDSTPDSGKENLPSQAWKCEQSVDILETSFAETMKVIDDFVADCDDLVSDFDRIAFRMEDTGADNDIAPWTLHDN